MMKSNKNILQKIPGVDKLLLDADIKALVKSYNHQVVKYCIRLILDEYRVNPDIKDIPTTAIIVENVKEKIKTIVQPNLKSVINATGVVIHTNLGRSPLGEKINADVTKILTGYNNLEFDLIKGQRGSRNSHVSELLKYLTGAEDVLVVNNNAASIMLILRTFAKNKEVIVSRSELIEIGGSFRLPDIMAASDCKMIEVGTTNKTKAKDYEEVINNETALLFKTHKSNYTIKGFTEEVGLKEMVAIGKKNNIPVVFDIGSGLLLKHNDKNLKDEPDIKSALNTGIDIICFSGDKLLGGPQAGIIVGKRKHIQLLKDEQMTRALRVGKTTIAFLEAACRNYLNEKNLYEHNVLFRTIQKTDAEIKQSALLLQSELKEKSIKTKIVNSKGQYGGGTLPDYEINSYSLTIDKEFTSVRQKSDFSVKLYHKLLEFDKPVVSILKRGNVYFDVLTIFDNEIVQVADTVAKAITEIS